MIDQKIELYKTIYRKKPTGFVAYKSFWAYAMAALCLLTYVIGAGSGMDVLAGVILAVWAGAFVVCGVLASFADKTAFVANVVLLSLSIVKGIGFLFYFMFGLPTKTIINSAMSADATLSGAMNVVGTGAKSLMNGMIISGIEGWFATLAIIFLVLFAIHKNFYCTEIIDMQRELKD